MESLVELCINADKSFLNKFGAYISYSSASLPSHVWWIDFLAAACLAANSWLFSLRPTLAAWRLAS